MRTPARLRWRTPALLLALILLPVASVGDTRPQQWAPGRDVRVATAPGLRQMPAALAESAPMPTLAHGYASLVERHAQLRFLEQAYPDVDASMAAICEREADLALVMGAPGQKPFPCPELRASHAFPGGRTMLAGRAGQRLPRHVAELNEHLLAVVDGGPYADWLTVHHPGIPLLRLADRHATLAAVTTGAADVAIGLESTLRPLIRRHFGGQLQVHPFHSDFSTDLHLLSRHEDQPLLRHIEQALRDITLEEHASLMHLWALQVLPTSLERTLDRVRTPSPPWLLALLGTLAGLPWIWHAVRGRRARQGRNQARAAGMISHEMRNAAQALLASIELLGQSSSPKGQRELLAAAQAASHALRGLLNRSLEFSRLASGTYTPSMRPCDITLLCNHALAALRPQARQKGLALRFDAPSGPAPIVMLDPEGVRQIVDNLLGNALKFTDIGGVELRLQLSPAPLPHELLLEVVDSGIGIPGKQLPLLFRPFEQSEDGQKRGGSGLGLVIAHELSRAMGGTLTVHSVHGRGSRFTLRLPVRPAATAAPPANAVDTAMPLSGVELLLVEDHALNRRMISEKLRCLGADVHALGDAAGTLAEQAVRPRSVILLDIGLQDMDGYALAKQLRGQARQPLRLIALSAHRGRRHAARCRRAGFDATLTKPLQIAELLRALERPMNVPASTCDIAAHWDPGYIADIGRELTRMEQAVEDIDAAALSHHAHRLQGTLQMCGAQAQAETAGDLWELGQDAAPDWVEARRLLRGLQKWHGSRKAEASPSA
ncbi:ATP-binding protein [Stenotrophomonas maltophilia]|uniref:ATP-binding protein n=1 Tax=Stenotrophomonas maltophilia TaxID=40324 RepID=UPI0015DFB954|nr:ATP-binding protein [Stenotrophomonas maltophilia]MBA0447410.1 response regulator [Stenotrophomonas maltophilia]